MNFILYLFLSLTAFAGQKPFCPDTWDAHMEKVEVLSEINQFLGRKGESPFQLACHGERDMNNPLKTGITRVGMAAMDSSGARASDFFLGLLSMIEQYAQDNIAILKNTEGCLTGRIVHEDCAIIKQWADVEVPERVKEARFHLSLAADPFANRSELNNVNNQLDPLMTFKIKRWNPLTPVEAARARSVLMRYNHQTKNSPNQVSALRDKRLDHLGKYKEIISELPMMNHITSQNPDREEILRAAVITRFHAEKELEKIQEMKQRLLANPRVLNPELLYAMNYSSHVEMFLLQNPRFCRIGAYHHLTKSNRQIAATIAVLPLLAASAFVAPPIAVGIGAAAGVAFVADSQAELNATTQRNLGQVIGDSQTNNEELRAAKFDRDANLIMAPFLGGGAGAASKFGSRLRQIRNLRLGQ